MSTIDLIKNTIPIIDVLERYANSHILNNRKGRIRFNIRCPFHQDRNPSFTVYTDTSTFRCWSGCNEGKSGDVIDIVMLSRNVNTKDAIKILIADYGLEHPDSARAMEWQIKSASRKRRAVLNKVINKKIFEAIDTLKEVELSARAILSNVRTVEELNRVGELYHVLNQIEYWFECLVENQDIKCRIQVLDEVSRFLHKMKEGERA